MTMQGPVKKQQPDGMSHKGRGFRRGIISWGNFLFEEGGEVFPWRNHLEERLLDQVQARASYTPLFLGRSCSIPQCMVSNV